MKMDGWRGVNCPVNMITYKYLYRLRWKCFTLHTQSLKYNRKGFGTYELLVHMEEIKWVMKSLHTKILSVEGHCGNPACMRSEKNWLITSAAEQECPLC